MFDELHEQVEAARARPEVADALRELYARVQASVEQRKPACDASGRCCKFDDYGHRLFVTTIELAVFLHDLEQRTPAPSPAAPGEGGRGDGQVSSLTLQIYQATSSKGVCPFQIEKLCGVHSIRPFGCRMFYCDPSAQQWQQEQYEQFHAELKRLHERLGVAYFYVEWRQALAATALQPSFRL